MRFPGFIGPSYTLQSVNVDCQRCVNLFPEMDDLGTGKDREVAALVPTPGLKLLLTLPNAPVRGLYYASNGQLFAVGGTKLYRISSAWAYTELGTLSTGTGAVSMSDNGSQVVIVDGSFGYYWDLNASSFTTINDAAFYPADQVTFQDGYFIYNRKNTQQFFIGPINAVTPFDPLDIASVEGSPDKLIGLIAMAQNVYMFGAQSIEVFYDSGDTFPFTRIQGAVVDVGCYAAFSIAKLQNQLYWLGGDETGQGIIYRMQGYQPQRISTPAIESVIRSLDPDTLPSARAWVYQQGGHSFYCLNLPGANSTWCFDAATQLWHERVYLDFITLERHRADCAAAAYGKNVVGDYVNGNVYALDQSTYNDNGGSIARIRSAPHVSQDMVNLFHHSFQLDMEAGVGLDGTGQGIDPQVMIRWSDDGGHTWSNGRTASCGKIGKTKTRVIWRRLGRSRDRVYEIKITDPVKTVLIGADINVEGGAA